jgi:hypothetical protein
MDGGYVHEIIEYFGNTLNAYSFLSHKWCISLIKYMVGSTIYVREENTHLMYSQSILYIKYILRINRVSLY